MATPTSFLGIIYQNYILQMSIDLIKENCFMLKKKKANDIQQKIIMDADYADDQCLLQIHLPKPNLCCRAWSRQQDVFTLNGKPLKLIDQFTYLGSNISSTDSDVNVTLLMVVYRLALYRWA